MLVHAATSAVANAWRNRRSHLLMHSINVSSKSSIFYHQRLMSMIPTLLWDMVLMLTSRYWVGFLRCSSGFSYSHSQFIIPTEYMVRSIRSQVHTLSADGLQETSEDQICSANKRDCHRWVWRWSAHQAQSLILGKESWVSSQTSSQHSLTATRAQLTSNWRKIQLIKTARSTWVKVKSKSLTSN